MNENLVQWVLMREPEYLQSKLRFDLKKRIGAELTTDYGRLDFVYETNKNEILVVEVETGIDSESKYRHCLEQIKQYKKLEEDWGSIRFRGKSCNKIRTVLLYAKDRTPKKYNKKIRKDCVKYDFYIRFYSLIEIQALYKKCIDRIKKTTGISLGKSVALGVSSLKWLNKIMTPFIERDTDNIKWRDLKEMSSSSTSFYVLKRLAEDFELIKMRKRKRENYIHLTETGKQFRDAAPDGMLLSSLSVENSKGDENGPGQAPEQVPEQVPRKNTNQTALSIEQKRILLGSLINGLFTKSKVNLFYFLRFVHITEGEWLPRMSTQMSAEEIKYINNILSSSYSERTLKELVQQSCNHCIDLGLVERIPNKACQYDKVMLTTIGSRVLGYLELYLHLKREQYQIPIQIGGE